MSDPVGILVYGAIPLTLVAMTVSAFFRLPTGIARAVDLLSGGALGAALFVIVLGGGVGAALSRLTIDAERSYGGDPPLSMQRSRAALVRFVDDASAVTAACRAAAAACAGREIIVQNPCSWRRERGYVRNRGEATYEDYAQTLCHELGHLNGWGGDHRVAAPRKSP